MKTKTKEFLKYQDIVSEYDPQPSPNIEDQELGSIYLGKSIKLNDGKVTGKLEKGQLIRVQFNRLVNCVGNNNATHIVMGVFGYISGSFRMEAYNLSTRNYEIIYLFD